MNPLVDKALKLRQEAENAKQEAITKLLEDRKAIGDQLKALGHIESQKLSKKDLVSDAKKYCKICQQFGHDGRFHRRKEQKSSALPKPAAPAAGAKVEES